MPSPRQCQQATGRSLSQKPENDWAAVSSVNTVYAQTPARARRQTAAHHPTSHPVSARELPDAPWKNAGALADQDANQASATAIAKGAHFFVQKHCRKVDHQKRFACAF